MKPRIRKLWSDIYICYDGDPCNNGTGCTPQDSYEDYISWKLYWKTGDIKVKVKGKKETMWESFWKLFK